ncbi:hypothetical protein JCM21900_002225 [Sporobolomyces salmonicolor]
MHSTPTPSRSRHSSGSYRTPTAGTPGFTAPPPPHSAVDSRRALALQSMARDPGTPVGKLLRAEGLATRSPRKIRQRSLPVRARDWASNRILTLETSLQGLSFDAAGYPLAILLNLVHFLVRLPVLYSALPAFSSLFSGSSSASRYGRPSSQVLGDADARLEALRRQAAGGVVASKGWSWALWWFSVLLIAVSVGNALYLTRKRRAYTFTLRQDPIASPNARSTTLDFSPTRSRPGLVAQLKSLIWTTAPHDESPAYPVQELSAWTPENALWSLRLFTLYPPPLALMYHWLTPSTFVVFAPLGGFWVLLTLYLVRAFTTLVGDRAKIDAEVMREYQVRFVNPRLSVEKRDAAVMTSEAEFVRPEDWRLAGLAQRRPRVEVDPATDEVVRRGSGSRRRESAVPVSVPASPTALDSPAPGRRRNAMQG